MVLLAFGCSFVTVTRTMLLYAYLILYDLEIGGDNAGPCLIIIIEEIDFV